MANRYDHSTHTSRRAFFRISALRWGMLALLTMATLTAGRAGAEQYDHWTEALHTPPWGSEPVRQAVVYNNQMWVTVQSGGGAPCRLWHSSDGSNWTLATNQIPCGPDTMNYDMVVFKNKLWVVVNNFYARAGGPRVLSTTNGTGWTTVTTSVPWIYGSTGSVLAYNNRLYVIGVNAPSSGSFPNAVYSSGDGANWVQETDAFTQGSPLTSLAVFDGKMWVVGQGSGGAWYSTDGRTWTRANTAYCEWLGAEGMSAFVHDGKLWTAAGYTVEYIDIGQIAHYVEYTYLNDLWTTVDGIHWVHASGTLPRRTSTDLQPVLSFGGKLWSFPGSIYYSSLPAGAPSIDLSGYDWDQTINEGTSYSSAVPMLAQGTQSVTWQLGGVPAGMTVDPNTGVITWPAPLTGRVPYVIRLRAVNAQGVDDATFTLTVKALPGLTASVPTFAQGNQTTLTWSSAPVVQSYTLQRDDARDFATPLETLKVSTSTLNHVFTGLGDGKTYWYRVRADRAAGLSSPWSNVTSCTQDGTAPGFWIKQNTQATDWAPIATARLSISADDPGGALGAGVGQMRFSLDGTTWSDWEPYARSGSVWVGRTGAANVYAQVRDIVGNITQTSTTVTVSAPIDAVYVDDGNTSGPWAGTLARPYRSLWDAVQIATHGQTIIVAPGTYGSVSFGGKNIVLRSADPQSDRIVKTTIIDGQRKWRAITFDGSENGNCKLAGFTLTRGVATYESPYQGGPGPGSFCYGGGIQGNGTHAAILNNRILDNAAYYSEVYGSYYDSPITYFYYGYGGGIDNCQGVIANNIIAFNSVPSAGSKPGSVLSRSVRDDATGKPFNPPPPTYIYSYDVHGAALYNCHGSIYNNTFWNNEGAPAVEKCDGLVNNIIHTLGYGDLAYSPNPSYCCLGTASTTGGVGNFVADPRLADPAHGDFHLLPDSPCIDAGMAFGSPLCTDDIDGDPRGVATTTTLRGDGSHFDIGADEYQPPSPAIMVLEPHGGEVMDAKAAFWMQFVMDPARAGTKARMEIRDSGGKTVKAWSFPAPGGALQILQHLPHVAGQGYRLRVISESNPALYAESAPFTIKGPTAVAPGGWIGYD